MTHLDFSRHSGGLQPAGSIHCVPPYVILRLFGTYHPGNQWTMVYTWKEGWVITYSGTSMYILGHHVQWHVNVHIGSSRTVARQCTYWVITYSGTSMYILGHHVQWHVNVHIGSSRTVARQCTYWVITYSGTSMYVRIGSSCTVAC